MPDAAIPTQSSRITNVLSLMMFLQFFAWGSWFATLSSAMDFHNLGDFKGAAYECAPIAAILAPLFLGLVADRLFASEKVMGTLMLLAGLIMFMMPSVAAGGPENGNLLVWMLLAHLLCYMPTLGLSNTIAFTHIPHQDQFPKIRVWGTIGWIVAGLFLGVMQWSSSFNIFWLGAGSSVLLGALCFFLPHTPPPLKGQPLDWRSLLMLDAFRLFKSWNFFVFAVCSTLICIPLAYYYGLTATYLTQTGFTEAGATMTLGQMSEIFFMLLIPFFFRRLGVKVMILIGMACWVARYLLFAYAAPSQVTWMLLLAVLLHGICYDFFFVTGFMYTDQKAPKAIRGQAQGLLVFLTQGVGMFFGYRIAAAGSFAGIPLDWTIGDYGKQVTSMPEYVEALKTARGATEPLSFIQSFGKMFSRDLPATIPSDTLATTMDQWKDFWMFPAIMAGIVFAIFALCFWDRTKVAPSTDD